jgi:hypothetical protein
MTIQRMDNVLIVVDDLEAALRGPEGIIIGLAEQLTRSGLEVELIG